MIHMDARQALNLTLSPQVLQLIKMLQFSQQELAEFVEKEVERNPLLDRAEPREAPAAAASAPVQGGGGWQGEALPDIQDTVADVVTLHAHLEAQLGLAVSDHTTRVIGEHIIRALEPTGYLKDPIELIAMQLGTDPARVEEVLGIVQGLEPAGIAARSVAECLALQLADRDRLDPAMRALIDNLDMLADRDFAGLRAACGVDAEDLADMIAEIRALDPRPGATFDSAPVQTRVPDVFVLPDGQGGWTVEINDHVLPRVLVDRDYHRSLSAGLAEAKDKAYLAECLQAANWLVRGMDQRMHTILNVTTEILRLQSGFFEHGIEHLRPLRLKEVAESLGIHESTVSRVTSNKSIATERGVFAMRFFFPTPIHGTGEALDHAADTVRHRIRQIVDAENPARPLSDDAIVRALKEMDIRIARRTVAKYRDLLKIPSSVERRRQKTAQVLTAAE